ncbi:MAG: rhodanese-like domain-containing protein [Gammaproteobacteria bacterium]|nr:rhodanese-like domain-containing protein [Gammaproteobacteria bacterium]MDP2140703.1 rhodanese-like domain-containing protein [Gammaproteobacteria bacterium]MDP2346959.1 rhodanese-like domain-containing protein [Gammaproteobacteria bacterium]
MRPLMRFQSIVLFFLISLPLSGFAAPQGWSPLLEPAQLKSILDSNPEVRVIHVTGDYAAGHIPGAVAAPYPQFRGPQENPGAVLDISALTPVVQRLGITATTPVAIVHQGSNPSDFGAAARVYWTLKSLGVQDLTLLNGGFNAWNAANLPVSTETASVAASTFTPEWNNDWRVTTAEVEALVADGSARLIDARPPTFFEGLQASTGRPGTIKGAGNLNFENWFEGSRVKPQPQVSSILASYEQGAAPITVSFCNTGHQAAVNWFVMSELQGVPNTRLYAESMTEWSMEDRPMDNQPSRIKHYWEMTTDWFSGLLGS